MQVMLLISISMKCNSKQRAPLYRVLRSPEALSDFFLFQDENFQYGSIVFLLHLAASFSISLKHCFYLQFWTEFNYLSVSSNSSSIEKLAQSRSAFQAISLEALETECEENHFPFCVATDCLETGIVSV